MRCLYLLSVVLLLPACSLEERTSVKSTRSSVHSVTFSTRDMAECLVEGLEGQGFTYEVDGRPMSSEEVAGVLRALEPGDQVTLSMQDGDSLIEVVVNGTESEFRCESSGSMHFEVHSRRRLPW